ncbi:hypothetical protein Taro_004105 [Colocasia esculenta]|uniref:Uncharacterized protein n=1 Tax=Colocasia esculenta TaxID=4460 RepID=A0A843TLI7_COLES|nr:hypothetical protein [Colocasia esculenta]
MLAGLLVEVAEVVISVVPVVEAVVVVMVVVAVAPPFPIVDPDPEGDLMWWQCQQPLCLLRSEVFLSFFFGDPYLFNTRQYAETVLYRYNSYMPLRYHQDFTSVQADPEIAN